MNEMRSPAAENAQLDLLGHLHQQGVGARQTDPTSPHRGGGYLNICTAPEVQKKSTGAEKKPPSRDPRLDDLRAMGLQRVWIRAAEDPRIGVDAVLALWQIIDADPQSSYDSATLRVPLLGWRTFLRYQRNRYIEQLRDMGRDAHEIQRRLNRQMGEQVSLPHIKRIMSGR